MTHQDLRHEQAAISSSIDDAHTEMLKLIHNVPLFTEYPASQEQEAPRTRRCRRTAPP